MSTVDTSVRQSIIVHAPRAHAFKVFTEGFDSWWPRSHRIGKGEPFTGILECREGGRWFERAADDPSATGVACSSTRRRRG